LFDEANIGILNCDSFEKNSQLKKLFDAISCGAALCESSKLLKRNFSMENSDSTKNHSSRLILSSPSPAKNVNRFEDPFIMMNFQLKELLGKFGSKIENLIDHPIF